VEGTDIRKAEVKDGGFGGFNPYGNEQSMEAAGYVIDVTEDQFIMSLMSLPWILLPCGCVFLRDCQNGAFLSRSPACWKFNHLFFSFIDGLFFFRQRQRCLDDIPVEVFRLISRDDLVPRGVRGVKDDGLGGFSPYGNEQMDMLHPVLPGCGISSQRGPVLDRIPSDLARLRLDSTYCPKKYAYYEGTVTCVTDYDYKYLLVLVEFGLWSHPISSWVGSLFRSNCVRNPLRYDLEESWRIYQLQERTDRRRVVC